MKKKYTYTIVTSRYYLEGSDEWEEDGEDIEYKPDAGEFIDALAEIMYDLHFKHHYVGDTMKYMTPTIKGLQAMLSEMDEKELGLLIDKYDSELFDYFKDVANEKYGD